MLGELIPSLSGREAAESSVVTAVVVVGKVGLQDGCPPLRGIEERLSPPEFLLDRFVESFHLAVGLGPADPREAVADALSQELFGESAAAPGSAVRPLVRGKGDVVVRQHSADWEGEVRLRLLQEGQRHLCRAAGGDGGEGKPCVIVDGGELEDRVLALEAKEIEHVEMEEFAWARRFIAHHGRPGGPWQASQVASPQTAIDGAGWCMHHRCQSGRAETLTEAQGDHLGNLGRTQAIVNPFGPGRPVRQPLWPQENESSPPSVEGRPTNPVRGDDALDRNASFVVNHHDVPRMTTKPRVRMHLVTLLSLTGGLVTAQCKEGVLPTL